MALSPIDIQRCETVTAVNAVSVSPGGWRRSTFLWLIAILLVGGATRVTLAVRATAPARDAFRYFAHARVFQDFGFLSALRRVDSQPIYPWVLARSSDVVEAATGHLDPWAWWRAAQGLGIALSLVYLALSFELGRRWGSERVAGIGTLLLAVWPRLASYGVDPLADVLAADFALASLLILTAAWPKGSLVAFISAGALSGLGFLTHLAAASALGGVGLLLFASLFVPAWRLSWRRYSRVVIGGAMGLAITVGPYALAIGGLTPRLAPRDLARSLKTGATAPKRAAPIPEDTDSPSPDDAFQVGAASASEGIGASVWRGWNESATHVVVREVAEETRVFGAILAVIGIIALGGIPLRWPLGLLPLGAITVALALMYLLKTRVGYTSGRYLVAALPAVAFLAAAGLETLARAAALIPVLPWERYWTVDRRTQLRAATVTLATLAVVTLAVGPSLLRPLHADRAGPMAAAPWLEAHAAPGEPVLDPTGCAAFFADRPQADPTDAAAARYAVVDTRYLQRINPVAREAIHAFEAESRVAWSTPLPGRRHGVLILERLPVTERRLPQHR